MPLPRLAPLALLAAAPFILAAPALAASAPAPVPPVPNARQIAWHDMEYYGFIHLGLNTFTDKEWGYGDEDPAKFNPSAFNADQIVASMKASGMKGIILTAKHHDGFCLWPTKTTPHNISRSPFRGGKGDLVREVSDACRRHGLKFGIYVSPWDRNHPEYGRDGYVRDYHRQIEELVTLYGPIFEIWFDGANGGDGYYGGKREKRSIDSSTYYQWEKVERLVHAKQPGCVVWGAHSREARWVGNERGIAPDPCPPFFTHKATGQKVWSPAEADVSIRHGWFWHERENAAVKTPRQLLDLYFASVGRNASLLLNVPPDRRGLVHENDVKSLKGFGDLLAATFSKNLAAGARAEASAVRSGDARAFSPANVLDADRHSYWTTDDGVTDASVTLTLPSPRTFNIVRLREPIRLGIRSENWAVDVFENGDWREYAKGKLVGACRLVRGAPVTTDRVRMRLSGGKVCPALSEFSLFAEPADLGTPEITRDKAGRVSLKAASAGTFLRYTLDGSDPVATSLAYTEPFDPPLGGLVKARAFDAQGASGDVATASFGLPKTGWKIAGCSANAGNADKAIDDNPKSLWHTHEKSGRKAPPQWVAVDMGAAQALAAFTVTPRTDADAGLVDRYRFEVSADGSTWKQVAEGEFSNIRANPIEQVVKLRTPVNARYFKFTGLRAVAGNQVAVAELGALAPGK